MLNHSKQLPLTIIIYPWGFRQFDWDRYELSFLEEKTEVIVCELIDMLTPNYAKAYQNRLEIAQVRRFTSLTTWIRFFKGLTDGSARKVTVMNFTEVLGPKEFIVNLILRRSKCSIVDFEQPGLPQFSGEYRLLRDRTRERLKKIFSKSAWNSLYSRWRYVTFQCLKDLFNLYPDYRLLAGKNYVDKQIKFCKEKKISIILGNSWDYSKISRTRMELPRDGAEKYAVLLDGAGPMFGSDSLLNGSKEYLTVDVWYPALTNFMDELEAEFNCKIIIAAHPKTKHEQYPSYFGGREVVHEKTLELVMGSEFVITRQSTAISYALAFKKPCIFIYSNQLLQETKVMRSGRYMSNKLGCNHINIDKYVYGEISQSLMSVDISAYNLFKMNYLTSVDSHIPNYKLILKDVILSNVS